MRRAIRLIVIAGLLASVILGTSRHASAYDVTWTKAKALDYAGDALYERYVWGGAKFRNNNTWDSDEGLDCSGYVAKVWAVDRYTYPMTYYHPYSTTDFYNGFAYEIFKDRTTAALLNAWTYKRSDGSGHMGLFISKNSDGTWKAYEAKGEAYGVVVSSRSISSLISLNYKRTDRRDWYYS